MSTDDHRAKTLARIAACLALAEDERTPHGEREAAAAKAAELMTRHGLDEAQARASRGDAPEQLKIIPYAVHGADGHGYARAAMIVPVIEAMGCRGILKSSPAPRPYTVIIAGTTSDVDSLRLLLPLITTQAQYAAVSTTEPGQRRRADFLPSFLRAYGLAVAERIAARRQPLTDTSTHPGAALILADRADRLAALIAERFGDLRTVAAPNPTDAGRRAGRAADIGDPRMTTGTRHELGR